MAMLKKFESKSARVKGKVVVVFLLIPFILFLFFLLKQDFLSYFSQTLFSV